VKDIRYNASDDLLAVGTFGRSAYTVENVTTTIENPQILEINGDQDFANQNDNITLKVDPDNPTLLDVTLNSVLTTFPLDAISEIHVNGLGGQDTLTLDYTNGNFIPLD